VYASQHVFATLARSGRDSGWPARQGPGCRPDGQFRSCNFDHV